MTSNVSGDARLIVFSQALAAFNSAMAELGTENDVTTFTESDFSRTFQPTSGDGSDHAWGSHHLVLGGAVQDFVILVASMRRGGKSLAEIAKLEIGPTDGIATAIAILFIVIVALAGLGFVVVNALAESAWVSGGTESSKSPLLRPTRPIACRSCARRRPS